MTAPLRTGEWDLRKVARPDDRRRIYTLPHETVRPSLSGAYWIATARRETSLAPLCSDGWRVVSGPPWGEGAVREEIDHEPPMHLDFLEWRDRRYGTPLEAQRPGMQDRALQIARGERKPPRAPAMPEANGIGIVLTLTGWSALEAAAVLAALDAAKALDGHVIVVQNDPDARERTEEGLPRSSRLRRVYTLNDGFAAACNAGLAALRPGTAWVLFTQADVRWEAGSVQAARVLARERRAIVGASGGMLVDGGRAIMEIGRNGHAQGGRKHEVAWVDFVAGYWVLAPVDAVRAVGGWWEGVFLYYEDPDLGLRLALKGYRSAISTALGVEHARSKTIGPRLGGQAGRVQVWSRQMFLRRWRVDEGK